MTKNVLTIIAVIISVWTPLLAQEELKLNVDIVIALTKNENVAVKQNQLRAGLAQADYQKTKEWWLPELFLGTTAHHLDGSAMNGDGGIFQDVDRQNRWYGGAVNLNWSPGQSISDSKTQRLKALSANQLSVYGQDQETLKAIESYYNLLSLSAKQTIYDDLIANKIDLVEKLTEHVAQGLALNADLLILQSNLSRWQIRRIELNQSYLLNASQILTALDRPHTETLYVDAEDLQPLGMNSVASPTDVSAHPLQQAQTLMLNAAHAESKGVLNNILFPNLGIGYTLGQFGAEYPNSQRTAGIQAYLGWKIPLGHVVYGGDQKIAKQKLAIQTLAVRHNETSLKNQITDLTRQGLANKEMLDLANQGSDFAQEALKQARLRRDNGLGDLYEVLLAEEEYIKSKSQYIDAVANFNLLQFQLKAARGERL